VRLALQQKGPRTFIPKIGFERTTLTSKYQAMCTAAFIFCGSINMPNQLKQTQQSLFNETNNAQLLIKCYRRHSNIQ